jgi:hypothetical protein
VCRAECKYSSGSRILRPHAVKDFINFVLKSFCFIRGLTQGSPLVTTLIIYFFKIYEVITSYFFKLFFYKIYEVITS